MAGGGPTGKGLNSEINVTPLVDVVLVMLIIFMVMAPLLGRGIKVKVPRKAEAQQQEQQEEQDQLIVRLTAEGELSLSGTVVELAELEDLLRPRLMGRIRDKRVVFFDAEPETNYGNCVSVMDVIKGSGAAALGIMTPKDGEGEEGAEGEAPAEEAGAP